MKNFLLAVLCAFSVFVVNAQNKTLGVGVSSPNPNAALHVESPDNNQGILIPRLSTTQRNGLTGALAATDVGLIVFDTDARALAIWNGTGWDIGSKVGAPISIDNNIASGSAATLLNSNAANTAPALAVNTSGTGNAIETAGKIQAGQFVGDGSAVTNVNAASVSPNTVASANIINNEIVNADVNPSAAISGTKINPDFGAQNITTTGTITAASFAGDGSLLTAIVPPTNSVSGSAIVDNTIENKDISATASIAGSKIDPNFGAQNINTTGTVTGNAFIGDGSALTGVIATPGANTVGSSQIIDGSIASADILDGTIANADISNVDASKITTGSLLVANGGTGATTAGAARTNLGLGTLATLGTVTTTEITDGTIATVDLANSSVSATKLANTAVTAGTYGSGTQVSQITVDAQGRLTSAANVAITGAAPTGTAGGDLAGTYPNPTVSTGAITSAKILDGTIVNADILNVDASKITTGTVAITAGGTGAATAATARTNLGLGSLAILGTVTTTEITDGTVTDVDVNAAAAIAGTKVNPNFGSQNISTTGSITATNTLSAGTGQFTVSGTGDITKINNIVTSFPSTQGAASTVLTNNGSGVLSWAAGGGFSLPYNVTQAGASPLFQITNSIDGGVAKFQSNGTGGNAGYFTNTNALNNSSALFVNSAGSSSLEVAGAGNAISATTTSSAGSTGATLSVSNGWGGQAANFYSAGSNPTLYIYNDQTGVGIQTLSPVLIGSNNSTLPALYVSTATNTSPAISINQGGTNNAITADAKIQSTVSGTANTNAFEGTNNSTSGRAGYFTSTNSSNTFPALEVDNSATGNAATFTVSNSSSPSNTLALTNSGLGRGAFISLTQAGNSQPALQINHAGTGNAITAYAPIQASVNQGAALAATASGTASAGSFANADSGNSSPTLYANTIGTGKAADISISNASNNQTALAASTNGTGSAILGLNSGSSGSASTFNVTNASNASAAVQIGHSGSGFNINSVHSGTGRAGYFWTSNSSNTLATIYSTTNGLGRAGEFVVSNTSNAAGALYASSNGNGVANTFQADKSGTAGGAGQFSISSTTNGFASLGASTAGTGSAALFSVTSASNSQPVVYAETLGTGDGYYLNHTGASGNLLRFQNNSSNVIRFTKTGLGIFNGGTQTGGADLAEAFEVEGSVQEYEPGDVLVISDELDRAVEKSVSANSTRVIGVYATKPGVLLTDKNVDDDLGGTIPLGVVGVIPTKVCLENGPIKKGDLLVTSSQRGHAMKANQLNINGISFYPSGIILGKALEDFDGTGNGKINVFVNVK